MISVSGRDAEGVTRFIESHTKELEGFNGREEYYLAERVDFLECSAADDVLGLYIDLDRDLYTVELNCESGLYDYECTYLESALVLYRTLRRAV